MTSEEGGGWEGAGGVGEGVAGAKIEAGEKDGKRGRKRRIGRPESQSRGGGGTKQAPKAKAGGSWLSFTINRPWAFGQKIRLSRKVARGAAGNPKPYIKPKP